MSDESSHVEQRRVCADICRVAEYEAQSLYSNIPQFYDFLQNRVLVQFKPRFEEDPGRTQDFDLMLSKKMTYDVVSFRSILQQGFSPTVSDSQLRHWGKYEELRG